MSETNTTPLKSISEEVLKNSSLVKDAYIKAEGEFGVVLDAGKIFRLTNRPFTMVDNLLGNMMSKSLERRLASGNKTVVCDLGGGYASRAASEILKAYQNPNLKVYNLDLFATELPQKDSRLNLIRGNFRTLPLQEEMFDIIYSWQLLENLHYEKPETIEAYQKIANLLKIGGEAFVDDTKLAKALESDQKEQDSFKEKIGISNLQFPMGKFQGEDCRKIIYLTKN